MKFWKSHTGIRILFPFLFGIIFAIQFQIRISYLVTIPIIGILLGFVYLKFSSYKLRRIIGITISIVLFLIGFQYTVSRTEKYESTHFSKAIENADYYSVKIVDRLIEKENSYKTIFQVIQKDNKDKIYSGKVLAYFKKSKRTNTIKYGDILVIKNLIRPIEGARNPNQFDYKNYLDLNQINYQVYLDSSSWLKTGENKANSLVSFSQKTREKLYSYLVENGVEGDQLKVHTALLLGYRENLDKELKKSYSSAGAMHVLAVSGLHVGILYLLLSNFFNWFKRVKKSKYIFAFLLIFILWFYALMTGLSASVMRASTMFTFIIIGDKLLDRSTSIYNTLAVSAVILLVINPYIAYEVGFQLSYAAVLGIVYLQPKLYKLLFFKNKILQKVWAISCVSIAAQIATFPLGLYYFHQFPVYFLVSNLVVIPCAILIFYLGIALFITAPFGTISIAIGKLMNFILWILNQAIFFTEKLAYSLIQEISISILETLMLYSILIITLFGFYYRKSKLFYFSLVFCFTFVSIQLITQYQSTQQNYLTFYSINKETVFEIVNGKKVYFISSNNLKDNWSTMLFNVNNNWNVHNIKTKLYINVDSIPSSFKDEKLLINQGVFYFNGKSIQVLEKNFKTNFPPDYLLVNKKAIPFLKNYLKQSKPKVIIFDSTISSYKLKYYTNWIDTNSSKIISLDKHYYSVDLSK